MPQDNRLYDYIEHMKEAVRLACDYVEGMDNAAFMQDRRTQQAVIMNLIVLGEAATKIMTSFPDFVQANAQIPWQSMRGMRNRMAHGYFDINLDLVWATVQQDLPELTRRLTSI